MHATYPPLTSGLVGFADVAGDLNPVTELLMGYVDPGGAQLRDVAGDVGTSRRRERSSSIVSGRSRPNTIFVGLLPEQP